MLKLFRARSLALKGIDALIKIAEDKLVGYHNFTEPAIYHHFPDKNALYLEAVRFAFSGKEQVFAQVWESGTSAEQKLGGFIRSLLDVMLQDRVFHRLMQREILEADPERMQQLVQGIFKSQFCLLMQLASELAPEQDAHLVATSIIGLTHYHVGYQPLLKHFPAWKPSMKRLNDWSAYYSINC